MTISPTVYWAVWTASFLAWGTLTYQYLDHLRIQRDSLAEEIRSFNARNGIDQSVDKEDLALDILVPLIDGNLVRCASNNGIEYTEYRDDLYENIGRPKVIWGLIFHILGIVFTISGITAMFPGGFISGGLYLIAVYLFFALSLGGFLLLFGRTLIV